MIHKNKLKKGKCKMSKKRENIELALKNIEKMISTLSYGSITVVIQDQHVVQIDKNEKIRLK